MGRGSGKTFLDRFLIHYWALERPGTHIGLLYPTLKQARTVMWLPFLFPDYYGGLLAYVRPPNKTDLSVEYLNGTRLTTWGAENADSIRGQRFDMVVQDEADDIHPDIEHSVVAPTFSRSGVNSIWVKSGTPRMGRYGSMARSWGKIGIEPNYFGIKVTSEQSRHVDSKWCSDMRREIPPEIYKREFDVDFDAAEGRVYSLFDEDFHVRPCSPYRTPTEVLIGVDWGFEDPGAIVVCKVFGSGNDAVVHIAEEHHHRHKAPGEWAEIVKGIHRNYHSYNTKWYADHSPGTIKEIQNVTGVRIREADKRNKEDAVASIASRLMKRPTEGGHEARLYVDPSCVETIKEFGLYRRRRDPRNREHILDDIQDGNDHCMDAMRYAIYSRFGYPERNRVVMPGSPIYG